VFSKQWICCQIGAREHYAVARALHQIGRLESLNTDFWARSTVRQISTKLPLGGLRSLGARFHPELADASVISWNRRSLLWEANLRRKSRGGDCSGRFIGYIEVGRKFACAVRESLKSRSEMSHETILFAYDTGGLEVMQWCHDRGIACVLNQMDPNRVEVGLVRAEAGRWPGWELQPLEVPEEYFVRREHEWALADRVVVNSEFCAQALVTQGVSREKLAVIPLCYESEETSRNASLELSTINPKPAAPLRVLWLGQVILRKGIQYLLQAARLLEDENIEFDIVGPIGISSNALASAPRKVVFHGRATRDQIAAWYRQASLFVLPTLSDGFAITQLEAMAHSLPVVATPCCGEVVSHGVDGFIVPPRDPEALARSCARYISEPGLLERHSAAAMAKSKQFNLDRLAKKLMELEITLHGN
jgi:glycosyltransferase involved in cell wall biosynthesis